MKLARPPVPPKKRAARAVAKRFRRLGIKTSKQNNFQFFLKEKFGRAGVKKLKENCFALLVEVRRAETRSGIIRAIVARKRFELRSVIATQIHKWYMPARLSSEQNEERRREIVGFPNRCRDPDTFPSYLN